MIVNQEIGHNEYKVARLKQEFDVKGVETSLFVNDGTLACIENNEIKINLPKCDFVIYMDKDIYLARLLEKAGYRIFNKADFIKLCDDKMLTFVACANLNIKMPLTISAPLVYYSLRDTHLKFLEYVEDKLKYPLVVKKVYGSLGEGVYLVNNHEELSNLYKQIARNPIIFQKYVNTSFGKSVRVLIIDGKVFGSFIRKNKIDFRSNFSTTASGEKLENKEKYESFAQDIANKLNIEYAGIDLLDDADGTPILCEINSNAFFEEFEKVTKLNAAKAIVEMIIKKVNHEQE